MEKYILLSTVIVVLLGLIIIGYQLYLITEDTRRIRKFKKNQYSAMEAICIQKIRPEWELLTNTLLSLPEKGGINYYSIYNLREIIKITSWYKRFEEFQKAIVYSAWALHAIPESEEYEKSPPLTRLHVDRLMVLSGTQIKLMDLKRMIMLRRIGNPTRAICKYLLPSALKLPALKTELQKKIEPVLASLEDIAGNEETKAVTKTELYKQVITRMQILIDDLRMPEYLPRIKLLQSDIY